MTFRKLSAILQNPMTFPRLENDIWLLLSPSCSSHRCRPSGVGGAGVSQGWRGNWSGRSAGALCRWAMSVWDRAACWGWWPAPSGQWISAVAVQPELLAGLSPQEGSYRSTTLSPGTKGKRVTWLCWLYSVHCEVFGDFEAETARSSGYMLDCSVFHTPSPLPSMPVRWPAHPNVDT